jgi:hypothetical protein
MGAEDIPVRVIPVHPSSKLVVGVAAPAEEVAQAFSGKQI